MTLSVITTIGRPPGFAAWRAVATSSTSAWLFASILWALGALLGSWLHVGRFVEREHARFSAGFDSAFATVVQRLDQNEALLDGFVALLRSSRDKEFPELRQYANEMLQRYPHLYTIGYQPRVGLAQREAFERRMSQRVGWPFHIRDFSFEGDRTWRVSPTRPFYFPVTFMAPELANARDVIGYDVNDDRNFRDAIERSGTLDQPVAALPFDLIEGGRGYIYLRALHLFAHGDADGAPTPDHLISLLVRADRLLVGARASEGGWLTLRHRSSREPATALIGGLGEVPMPLRHWSVPLPELHLRRATPSMHQPFELDLVARPRWQDFSWNLWSMWLGAWTTLVFGGLVGAQALWRSQRLRTLAQEQTALARQDIAAAEQRADASRARSLDELSSGIAHELNQPLTAVVGYSQAALRMLDSSATPSDELLDRVRATLQANAQQALRAGELMQRLRTLVRKQPVRMQPLFMQDVVASALRLEQSRIDAAAVVIDTRLPKSGIELLGDAMLIEQLLTNLVRNAVESLTAAATARPRIVIDLDSEDARCRLTISDNGPGMNAEQRARAFHPFRSTKAEGVGIGLVVCAAIAQAHGGDIRTESPADGGARFIVTLPVKPVSNA